MFNQNQYYYGYPLQQNWMNRVNMGNHYYAVSPSPIIPTHQIGPNFQHHLSVPPIYHSNNASYHMQPLHYQAPQAFPYFGGKNNVQSIFQNPLEPKNPYSQQMYQQPMNFNPYPKPNMVPRPNGGFGSIMNSFKGQDGSLDLNKMVNTAGQMMNAVSQVSAMVKGLGGILKV